MSEAASDHPRIVIFPPILFLICIALGSIAAWLTPWRLHASAWMWIGLALIVAAISLALWGDTSMKAAGTNVRPDRPTTAIVDNGPFAYSRNPLYIAFMTLFAGLGLALRSPAFLAFLVPLVLVLRYGVVRAE